MADPIGEIPIIISGDWSELEKDLQQAESVATRGGHEIASAFSDAASQINVDFGEKIAEAFNIAGAGSREYSTDAEALVAKQKELEVALVHAQGTLAEIQNAFEAG